MPKIDWKELKDDFLWLYRFDPLKTIKFLLQRRHKEGGYSFVPGIPVSIQ